MDLRTEVNTLGMAASQDFSHVARTLSLQLSAWVLSSFIPQMGFHAEGKTAPGSQWTLCQISGRHWPFWVTCHPKGQPTRTTGVGTGGFPHKKAEVGWGYIARWQKWSWSDETTRCLLHSKEWVKLAIWGCSENDQKPHKSRSNRPREKQNLI